MWILNREDGNLQRGRGYFSTRNSDSRYDAKTKEIAQLPTERQTESLDPKDGIVLFRRKGQESLARLRGMR